jgi:hypothetical protein
MGMGKGSDPTSDLSGVICSIQMMHQISINYLFPPSRSRTPKSRWIHGAYFPTQQLPQPFLFLFGSILSFSSNSSSRYNSATDLKEIHSSKMDALFDSTTCLFFIGVRMGSLNTLFSFGTLIIFSNIFLDLPRDDRIRTSRTR